MKKRYVVITNLLIVAFLIGFFTKVSPLIVYNCDDWIYLGNIRLPIPIWGGWNPTRVFFETFMPIVGRIAGYIVYPLIGDYVYSVTCVSAIVLSALITVMCICMYKVLTYRLNRISIHALAMEVIFLSLFFLIFRTRSQSNYMFCAEDLCCVFNYTMPGILNAIVVLYMARYKKFSLEFKDFSWQKKILFLILLYFALLSNIFHSIITVSYCSAVILLNARNDVRKAIKENVLQVVIVFLWLFVLLFEKSGGRADDIGHGFDSVKALLQFKVILLATSVPFKLLALLSVGFIACRMIQNAINKHRIEPLYIVLGLSLVIITVFLLLLNSIVGYMSRVDATWGIWFFLIVICTLALDEILYSVENKMIIVPIVVLVFIVCSYYPDGKFMISSSRNRNYDLCYMTSTYYADNIVETDKNGLQTVEIAIPEVEIDDVTNLTFYRGFGDIVSNTLYLNGVIDHKVEVIEVIDSSLNQVFLSDE